MPSAEGSTFQMMDFHTGALNWGSFSCPEDPLLYLPPDPGSGSSLNNPSAVQVGTQIETAPEASHSRVFNEL